MSGFNRRSFLKFFGKYTGAIGIGLSSNMIFREKMALASDTKSLSKTKEPKFQIFERGKYLGWEKEIVEERFALASGASKSVKTVSSLSPVVSGVGAPDVVNEQDLLSHNKKWDPYNPLFNDKEYAQKAGYQDVPAFPDFKSPMDNGMMLTIPNEIGDRWYYAHGPDYREYFEPIFAGDSFTSKIVGDPIFEENTENGSDFRKFTIIGGESEMYNQSGKLVSRRSTRFRNGYKKYIDGTPKASYTDMHMEWAEYLPPAHITTDEEWEYIKELWNKEHIRGEQKLYWEDVRIGDEPTWTCSGPITYMDMIGLYNPRYYNIRDLVQKNDKNLFRDPYGQYLFSSSLHFGGRNIPGHRAIFYNDTPAKHITRMVTNYVGDAGFIVKLGWMFQQFYKEFQDERVGGEYLDKVPYMKGKGCTVHGGEGDTVIAKGYVTDKYKNENGEGIIDLTCWGETLDNQIIEVVPISVRLPLKKG